MTWDRAVPGCFGNTDLIFTSHRNDEDRAFAWLTDLRTRGIGWEEARAQLKAFLESKGASASHIQYELTRARTLMKPWLLD